MPTDSQKALFLLEAKRYVADKGIILVPRKQNLEFLASHGLSIHDLEHGIENLQISDFVDGPEPDRDEKYREWTVAEFRTEFDEAPTYLKISVKTAAGRCKCLSVKLWTSKQL